MIHLPPHLQVHPEVNRHIEKRSRPQCCAWRHASTSMDNISTLLLNSAIENIIAACIFEGLDNNYMTARIP